MTPKLAPTAGHSSGAQTYRGKITIGGKRRRIELTVAPADRKEGDLPQLVRVTLK